VVEPVATGDREISPPAFAAPDEAVVAVNREVGAPSGRRGCELQHKIPTRVMPDPGFRPTTPWAARGEKESHTTKGFTLMEISTGRVVAGGLLMAGAFTALGAGTAFAFQEHMFSARNDLQQAVSELRQSEPDKGGHRDVAINLTQQAIDQVNTGIQYAAGNPPPPEPPPPPWAPPRPP
jgi:hypothetical protein